MCIDYMQTWHYFYIRELSIHRVWYRVVLGTNPPRSLRDDCMTNSRKHQKEPPLTPLPLLLSSRKVPISKFLSLEIYVISLLSWPHTLLYTSFAFKVAQRLCGCSSSFALFSLFGLNTRSWWAMSYRLLGFVFGMFGKDSRPPTPWLGCEALGPLLQEVHQPILQESLWLAFGELDPVVWSPEELVSEKCHSGGRREEGLRVSGPPVQSFSETLLCLNFKVTKVKTWV